MKKGTLLQIVFASLLMLVMHNQALAHSALRNSVPGNGQTVSAPSMVMLAFDGSVRLVRMTVTGDNGPVDIGFVPQAAASSTFHVNVPALPAGAYRVDWTILGADGHSVTENFRFTVDPSAPAAVMDHSHGGGDDHQH